MKCIVHTLSIYIIYIECGRMDTLYRGISEELILKPQMCVYFNTVVYSSHCKEQSTEHVANESKNLILMW